jgi:hypothetical protein
MMLSGNAAVIVDSKRLRHANSDEWFDSWISAFLAMAIEKA